MLENIIIDDRKTNKTVSEVKFGKSLTLLIGDVISGSSSIILESSIRLGVDPISSSVQYSGALEGTDAYRYDDHLVNFRKRYRVTLNLSHKDTNTAIVVTGDNIYVNNRNTYGYRFGGRISSRLWSMEERGLMDTFSQFLDELSRTPYGEFVKLSDEYVVSSGSAYHVVDVNGRRMLVKSVRGAVRYMLNLAYVLTMLAQFDPNEYDDNGIIIFLDDMGESISKFDKYILPRFVRMVNEIADKIGSTAQIIVATPSPIIAMSAVDIDGSKDDGNFIVYDVNGLGNIIEFLFENRGTLNEWVTSIPFEWETPYSDKSEIVVLNARLFAAGTPTDMFPVGTTRSDVAKVLADVLPEQDPMVIRWSAYVKD